MAQVITSPSIASTKQSTSAHFEMTIPSQKNGKKTSDFIVKVGFTTQKAELMHHLKQQSFFYVHTKKQHTEASGAVWNVVVVASHIQMIRNG